MLLPFPSLASGSPLHPLDQRKTARPLPMWEEQSQLLPEDGGMEEGAPALPLLMPPSGRTHRGVSDKSASHIESQLAKTLGILGVVCSAHLQAAGQPGLPGLSTKEGNSKE